LECKDSLAKFIEATKAASIYKEECTRLSKSIRRFSTVLDDLEDNHLAPDIEKQGIAAVKVPISRTAESLSLSRNTLSGLMRRMYRQLYSAAQRLQTAAAALAQYKQHSKQCFWHRNAQTLP
jgi:prefoldin subunit 5